MIFGGILKVEELENELNKGILKSLYLLYGEERFLLESALKKMIKLFGETLKGVNYINIDENNVEEIIPNLETPSFGFEKKLIVAKNTGLFKKESKKKTKKDDKDNLSKIINYLRNNFDIIKDNVTLIFIEEEADKTSELLKLIDDIGITCNFEFQKPAQIAMRLKAIANAYNVNIDNPTLNYFIEECGTSMQELINEIRKLIEYSGKRRNNNQK